MRAFLMGAGVAMVLSSAAMADDSVMTSRFGNTTVATYPDGTVTKIYYTPDHAFTLKVGSQTMAGTWKVDGDKLCLTYGDISKLPAGTPNPTCAPAVVRKIGDTWTVGDGAMKRTVTLVQGVQ